MAVINVVGDYSISIDNNGDHEARRFVKMNKMVDNLDYFVSQMLGHSVDYATISEE